MKRILIIISSAVFTISAVSGCAGSTEITPLQETVSGPLGEYFKVVNRTYKITDDKVNIEIERTDEGLPDPWVEGMEVGYSDNDIEPEFIVEFLDADGDVVYKSQTDIVLTDDELKAVIALAEGESSSIPFRVIGKKISKFKVSSTFTYHKPRQSSNHSSYSAGASSVVNDVTGIYNEAQNEIREVYEDEYEEAVSEVKEAYRQAVSEVKEAYDEAADEVKEAYDEAASEMRDALEDLF